MKNDKVGGPIRFPEKLLAPIKLFLEEELAKLQKRKKDVEEADPFQDQNRVDRNSVEEDVDEQLGHADAEVKAKFLTKQIVNFRKSLTRMKIGKYGICSKCGKMIDTDRLAVRPEATTCIKCREEMDS